MSLLESIENEVDLQHNSFKMIDSNMVNMTNQVFNVISLFSGCGGMDLGFKGGFEVFGKSFERNNFNIVFANDIVKTACDVYEHNFNHKSYHGDIKNLESSEIPKADVVIGGFPCQDFSHAGNRKGLTSERGRLYLEMKRVVETAMPMAFVAENVDGIRTSKKGTDTSALDEILTDFRSIGYNVEYKVLNSADYGVPQTRIRVIIIGIRSDLNKEIYFPSITNSENHQKSPWMTSKQAIDDLWNEIGTNKFHNHTDRDFSRAKFYPGKKMQGNYKIKAEKPSITIRAEHHGNIEAHYRSINEEFPDDPKYWRRLSVRECARLQSFPDSYNFTCSSSKAYKLIGNAVPPMLAWHISRALYYSLTKK